MAKRQQSVRRRRRRRWRHEQIAAKEWNGMEWNVPQLPHSHSHTAIAMAMSGTSVWHRDTTAWDSGIGTWGAWGCPLGGPLRGCALV